MSTTNKRQVKGPLEPVRTFCDRLDEGSGPREPRRKPRGRVLFSQRDRNPVRLVLLDARDEDACDDG